ncbi:hypothetical protein [Shewanella piezotolerans]
MSTAFANEVSSETYDTDIAQDVAASADRSNKFKPIILPFYDPSIKAGITAIPLFAFYPDDNDLISDASTIAVPLIYTSNDSYIAKVSGDIILFEDNFRLSFETGFTSTNQPLSGIDSNKETIDFDADFMFKVLDDFYLGVGAIYTSTKYTADNAEEQSALEAFGFTSDYQDDIGYRVSCSGTHVSISITLTAALFGILSTKTMLNGLVTIAIKPIRRFLPTLDIFIALTAIQTALLPPNLLAVT